MRPCEVEIRDDGSVELSCMPPGLVEFLLQLPGILAGGSPFVGEEEKRDPERVLFPSIHDDEDEDASDWDRYGRPDLLALFASRQRILAEDLGGLEQHFVILPWLAQIARVDGGELEDEDEDLDDDEDEGDDHAAGGDDEDEGDDSDLSRVRVLPAPFPLFRVRIPAAHRTAWLTGLNGARLLLAERYDLMDEDRELPTPLAGLDRRAIASAMINTFGLLEEQLIEAEDAAFGEDDA
ncbi:MAG: DUF2017 family protein [Planctomycetota bacterium]